MTLPSTQKAFLLYSQIAAILLALTGTFYFVKYQSEATAQTVVKIETRVRALEIGAATKDQNLIAVQRDIADLKMGQREINSLLRELLGQRDKR